MFWGEVLEKNRMAVYQRTDLREECVLYKKRESCYHYVK